ncbi:MAG TPA: ABC transporter substrate-binding protein [Candidatus Bathyarchaeia archaeon]|nr:ABC transporter substrate-binding protein [Candidatus Bathyarchaeia archaeon]
MRRDLTVRSLAVLIVVLSVFMVLGPLSTVEVKGAGCATGLSPRLHVTLLVPTSNPARRAWAAIIQNSLQCLGMDVSRVELPFSPNIYARALSPPTSIVGKTFDQGGFDILFVGYNLLIDPDPYGLYHSSQFPPAGQNYYLWNNTQNDNLTNQIKTTLDATARNNLVKQWQVLAYNELPSIPLLYTHEIVAFDSDYSNAQQVFQTYHFPAWPPIEHLTNATNTSQFILAETGQAPGEGVVPELSTSYYDLAISGELFSGLSLRNDTVPNTGQAMIPALAAGTPAAPGWSVSPDGKTWDVNLRSGVTWHDGQPFTSDDVKFTYDLYQNDTFGAQTESFVKSIVGGKNNVTITGPLSVRFTLPAPYAFFVQNILTTAILPKHVLQPAFGTDYSKITNSLFNHPDTGTAGTPTPVGTGPYKWVSYNAATSTSHLVRNDNYFDFSDWGRAALLAKNQFRVKDYYVRTIVGSDAAITALTNHEVDFLDSQYHLETQQSFLTGWGASKQTSYDAFGVQEMGVNMQHPIIGTGTGTPYAQQYSGNKTAAANAARWIRQAISYATPRDQIITSLLNGAGVAAITTPIIGNYKTGAAVTQGFNPTLQPYAYNLTKAGQLLQSAGYSPTYGTSFIDAYGVYIIVAVVVAAVAVAAVYVLRVRRRTASIAPPGSGSAPPATSP